MSSTITKRALFNALQELLKTRPTDKITISEITEACGVNRMTFYYHFKDIYDLVEWMCEDLAKDILKDHVTYNTWQEGFLDVFLALINYKPIVLHVYNSVSREQLERYLFKVTYKFLISVINEEAKDYSVKESDLAFVANFYKYGFVGIVLDWIKRDMKDDPVKIIEHLNTMIRGDFKKAIQRYSVSSK